MEGGTLPGLWTVNSYDREKRGTGARDTPVGAVRKRSRRPQEADLLLTTKGEHRRDTRDPSGSPHPRQDRLAGESSSTVIQARFAEADSDWPVGDSQRNSNYFGKVCPLLFFCLRERAAFSQAEADDCGGTLLSRKNSILWRKTERPHFAISLAVTFPV